MDVGASLDLELRMFNFGKTVVLEKLLRMMPGV